MGLNCQAPSSLGAVQAFSQVASSYESGASRVGLNSQASSNSGSGSFSFGGKDWIERLDERLDISLAVPYSKKES